MNRLWFNDRFFLPTETGCNLAMGLFVDTITGQRAVTKNTRCGKMCENHAIWKNTHKMEQ